LKYPSHILRTSLEIVDYPPTGHCGEESLSMMSGYFSPQAFHPKFTYIFSWNAIRNTVNVTDDQLLEKYKTSALYAAVIYCSQQQDGLSLVIPPVQASILPSQEELAARFPGYSDSQMSQLMRDYEEEANILKDLAVEDVLERVKELAIQEDEQEDVDMSILPG